LSPGREVRLRYAYFITCTSVVKDSNGDVVEIHCTYDPATRGGNAPDGRKVKSTIHWVSAANAVDAEVRLYETLFTHEDPGEHDELNPASIEILAECKLEPALAHASPSEPYQFERLGYFCADPDTKPGSLVFNRTVALKDTWAKIEKRVGQTGSLRGTGSPATQ
jgi:glutaminyl-tRNA synthetase